MKKSLLIMGVLGLVLTGCGDKVKLPTCSDTAALHEVQHLVSQPSSVASYKEYNRFYAINNIHTIEETDKKVTCSADIIMTNARGQALQRYTTYFIEPSKSHNGVQYSLLHW